MGINASSIASMYRPSECLLRPYLRAHGVEEEPTSPYEEVLKILGDRHEKAHLASLGTITDLSGYTLSEKVTRTKEAIERRDGVVYQPGFAVSHPFSGASIDVVGIPDFLIWDVDGYVIRDAKVARRINSDDHPEIELQLQTYAFLFRATTGLAPKRLEVFSGAQIIVQVPDDGGAAALAALARLVAIRNLSTEPYEPVGWSKCGGCGFFDYCWNRAMTSKDCAVLQDVDQSLAQTLHDAGVTNWQSLLDTYDVARLEELKRPRGTKMAKVGAAAPRILLNAELMIKQEFRVLGPLVVKNSPNYVMFDLEGIPPHLDQTDIIYLWGMQVFGSEPSAFMPGIAGFGADGDKEGWFSFLNHVDAIFRKYGDIPFIHWASYEKTYVDRYIKRYGDVDGAADRLKNNLCDLFSAAKKSIALPLPSFSLKQVEKYVGYKRSQEEFGGDWAMAKFIEATETENEGARNDLMDMVLQYNKEDLEAMWAVFEWLQARCGLIQAATP